MIVCCSFIKYNLKISGTEALYQVVVLEKDNRFMSKRCTESANHVEYEKTFWSPYIFKYRSKYKQGIHVKEDMPETTMHKHMGDNLQRLELCLILGNKDRVHC